MKRNRNGFTNNQLIIIILYFIIIGNVITTKIAYVSLIIAIFQWVFLAWNLIKRKYEKVYIWLIVFTSCTLEARHFVYLNGEGNTLYCIYNLPFIGSWMYRMFIFLIFLCIFLKYHETYKILGYQYGITKRISLYLILMLSTGVLTGFIGYIINDNNVKNTTWYFRSIINTSIDTAIVMSILYCSLAIAFCNNGYRTYYSKLLIDFLIASLVATVFTVLAGYRGFYGYANNMMLMPLASALCATMIIFPAFDKKKRILSFAIMWVIFLVISLIVPTLMGSKYYLLPVASLVIFIVVSKKYNNKKGIIMTLLFFIVLPISAMPILTLLRGQEFSDYKFSQLLGMFRLFESGSITGWYNGLASSPRTRIDEFVNIFLELCRKPWCAPFGKGIPGSIKHIWGTTNWQMQSSFMEEQINSGIFSGMHETVNVLFIRHGILGLTFFIDVFLQLAKKIYKSQWAIIAIIWLTFYWGIYKSWFIGIVAIGLCLADDKGVDKEPYESFIH